MSVDSSKARSIFLSAVENCAPEQWPKFLDDACGDNAELRARVELLLKAHQGDDSFLDRGQEDEQPVGATIDQPVTEGPGARIGPYKLLQQIGQGGMGVVYMAEQTEPVERRVALKIIKPGMDTRQVIARFEAERQALAMMDHPNIARVLDAGTVGPVCRTGPTESSALGDSGPARQAGPTSGGRPYFVMELVKGVPITKYCDQQHLTPKQRLELFIPVCHAVQHAHQKGLIHRDLKPSNILVARYDDHAVPKVIDFGVAKATAQRLTEKTMFTQYGQIVGTLEYMSPEQAQLNQWDIDTRSDIYSLGVLLYELLTGTTPLDRQRLRSAAFDEMLRMIREEEPPRPSTRLSTIDTLASVAANRRIEPQRLSTLVRGELDWIVMKALEKDRGRRYETANGFAADIERYLIDEPVEACPPSAAYRFRKFARRNKAALATASLLAAALIFGMAGTAWQAIRATQAGKAARRAEQAAKAQRDVANAERSDADKARRRAEDAKDAERAERERATRLLTSSYVDAGQSLCEEGEIGRGMLWLAHSLETAPDDAADLQRVARTNLAAWSLQLHSLRMLVQHDSEVVAVALNADGSRVLTGCADGSLRIWEAATGRGVAESVAAHWAWGHQLGQLAHCLAFSPDGSRILTAGYEATARLWDAGSLAPIGEPLAHAPAAGFATPENRVKIAAFSPDGSRIVTASGVGNVGTIRLWDARTLQPVGKPFRHGNPEALRFTPDGLCALTTVQVRPSYAYQMWNVERGEPIGPPLTPGFVTAAAIRPDGAMLATGLADGGRIKLWRVETGDLAAPPIVHGGVVLALDFSPDGSRLVSGGNTRASMLWDTATGEPVGTPLRQQSTAYAVAFSRSGRRIATGGKDGSVRIWEVSQDRSIGRPVRCDDPVVAAGYSPDGLRILTESDGSLQLRDATTGEAIGQPFPAPSLSFVELTFSPDGSSFLTGRQLRHAVTGELLGELAVPYLHGVAFSPDGSRILSGVEAGSGGSFAQLWDAATMEPMGTPLPHRGVVMRVAFAPDGSQVLTGSLDGTTRLWDAATTAPLREAIVHQSEVKSLDLSPDGARMVIGFADGTVRLWDLGARKPVGAPLHHKNIVSGAAFSPEGSRFLTCSLDETARLWDAATRKPIGPVLRHEAWWPWAAFRADGAELLVAPARSDSDHPAPARLWQSPPGPLEGDRERILLWTQVITGMELDESDGIGALDGPDWQERYRRLQELGGPPKSAPLPPPPPKTETDYSRSMELAVRARGRAERGQWDEAAADFATALELAHNSPTLRNQIALWCGKLAKTHKDAKDTEHRVDKRFGRDIVLMLEKLSVEPPPTLLSGGAATPASYSEMYGDLAAAADGDWVRMFDGQTLQGWKASENEDTWKVEGGALVCDGLRSHLFYVGEAELLVNFEFQCEVMTTPGGNSGIFFHTQYQDVGSPLYGYETQIYNSPGGDPRKTGCLFGVTRSDKPPCRDNEYWTHHIVVVGKRIVVQINGQIVADYTEPEGARPFRRLGRGTFALQAMPGSKVFFRNLMVRRLPLGLHPCAADLLGLAEEVGPALEVALRGRDRAEQGHWDDAAADFAAAIERAEGAPALRARIAGWWEELAEEAMSSDNQEACGEMTRRALALLEDLAEDLPNKPQYRERLVPQYVRLLRAFVSTGGRGDLKEARSCYEKALPWLLEKTAGDPQREPLRREVERLLGVAASDRTEILLQHYTDLIERDSDDWQALAGRAGLQSELKQWEQAIEDYSAVIRIKPDHARSYKERSRSFRMLGDLKAALADADRSIDLDWRNPWMYVQRAQVRCDLGDHEQAIADCDEALRLDTRNTTAWMARATAKRNLERYESAAADAVEGVRILPDNVWAWAELRRIGLAAENPDLLTQPLADLRKHFGQLESNSPVACRLAELYATRAKMHQRHGDAQKALADCRRAMALHPDDVNYVSLRKELEALVQQSPQAPAEPDEKKRGR